MGLFQFSASRRRARQAGAQSQSGGFVLEDLRPQVRAGLCTASSKAAAPLLCERNLLLPSSGIPKKKKSSKIDLGELRWRGMRSGRESGGELLYGKVFVLFKQLFSPTLFQR